MCGIAGIVGWSDRDVIARLGQSTIDLGHVVANKDPHPQRGGSVGIDDRQWDDFDGPCATAGQQWCHADSDQQRPENVAEPTA